MKGWIRHITLLIALAWCGSASAQYYSWGADPESMSWRKIKGDKIAVIYPDTARTIGYQLFHYVEAIKPSIDFGFRYGPMNIPFVIHPENASSNGLVMWLPKRVEILSSPAITSYSMPWLKQLAAHEYRHAVQYNNINKGWVKAFSYLLGQQSSTIGLLFMPLWGMEGDAVLSETAMSSYGRALQPSFTMHYRAIGNEILRRRNNDKWFCGSFKDFIPDHYHLGYQITAYADTKYDENIWDKVVNYAVRNPYVFATTYFGLKKYYNTSTNALFHETFTDLNNHWATLPEVEDSASDIPTPKRRSYTTYNHPIPFGQDHVISVKTSLDKPSALVKTNTTTGHEERICHTGAISSRPILQNGRLWWTEYRRSMLYEQRVNSRLCYIDLGRQKPRTVFRYRNVLYPTAIGDSDSLAWVEYRPDGSYAIMRGTRKSKREMAKITYGTEIHSLAYDNLTDRLYFIATSDDGMWLGRINDDGTTTRLTKGAYITISNLTARDGILYFGSIASGKDEVHCFNLADGSERRISTSKYGSFAPHPRYDNRLLMTTYDRNGYRLTQQSLDTAKMERITPATLPVNLVNPKRKQWNVINLDTVRFAGADSLKTVSKNRSRYYSKFTHLFNIHSWAPVSYDPFALVEEGQISANLGATIMSQSLLSNTEGFFTWAWNHKEGHFIKGLVRYSGLGMNLSLSGSYGSRQHIYTAYSYEPDENGKYNLVFPEKPKPGKYYNITASISLPLFFDLGYRNHYVGINSSWSYSNGLVANVGRINIENGKLTNLATIGFSEGLHILQFGIGYQSTTRLAHRDFIPKWGHAISFNYALNPADTNFGQLLSFYGKLYLPGFAPHHSFTMEAAYQTSISGFESDMLVTELSFNSTRLLPRGFYSAEITNRNYTGTSLNYHFPICYPDGGILSFLYFKRIRLNLGFDYASFDKQYFVRDPRYGNVFVSEERKHIFSYGGDVTFDVNLFGMPDAATTAFTISIYKPHNKKGIFFSAGLGLPF